MKPSTLATIALVLTTHAAVAIRDAQVGTWQWWVLAIVSGLLAALTVEAVRRVR